MATTVAVSMAVTITGQLQGGSDFHSLELTNSNGVGSVINSTSSTSLATAVAISLPTSAKMLIVIPNSTNPLPLRITDSTSDTGIQISSRGFAFLAVNGGTTKHIYTTGTTGVPFTALIY